MKTQLNMILGAVTILMTLFLANCGSNSGSSSATTPVVGQSCGTNMLQSQYGCLPQCSTNAVQYNGTCTPISSSVGIGGASGFGGVASQCSGSCGAGYILVSNQCLPQYTCGSCYGYYGGYCYKGDYLTYLGY